MSNTEQLLRLSRSEAEDFLFRQAEYLDSRDFEAWFNLFTADGSYWIPYRSTDTDPETQMSFMFDDVPMMMARCERLLDPRSMGQQPTTRSSHVVGNVQVLGTADTGELIVRSRFHVTQFRRDVLKFYAGAYTHHLVDSAEGIKIQRQRVDLIDCDGIHDAILQVYL
jgi:3-phenylpropionate/cinnamic acid dioxygenase small subunit